MGVGFGGEPEWPAGPVSRVYPRILGHSETPSHKAKHWGLFYGRGSIGVTPAITFLTDQTLDETAVPGPRTHIL